MLSRSKSADSMCNTRLVMENPFYSDLSSIMNDPTFQKINKNYFQRWSDIEVFFMYIKLYEAIETITPRLNKQDILSMIHVLMTHCDSRRKLVNIFQNFKQDEDSFLKILKQHIQTESMNLIQGNQNDLNT